VPFRLRRKPGTVVAHIKIKIISAEIGINPQLATSRPS
jgi:hypothetical protein